MSAEKKLSELQSAKNDPKHADLSILIKKWAEFQLELSKEAATQSRVHLIVAIVAVIVALAALYKSG